MSGVPSFQNSLGTREVLGRYSSEAARRYRQEVMGELAPLLAWRNRHLTFVARVTSAAAVLTGAMGGIAVHFTAARLHVLETGLTAAIVGGVVAFHLARGRHRVTHTWLNTFISTVAGESPPGAQQHNPVGFARFDETQFYCSTESNHIALPWGAVAWVMVRHDFIAIAPLIECCETAIIPRQAFRDQAHFETFCREARQFHSDAVGSAADQVASLLRDRFTPCPSCAYDLRDVAGIRCPECGMELSVILVGLWQDLNCFQSDPRAGEPPIGRSQGDDSPAGSSGTS